MAGTLGRGNSSLDEHNGYFRIVTTQTKERNDRDNKLFILRQNDALLEVIAQLPNTNQPITLGDVPNSHVSSIEYTNDKAFVSTYDRQNSTNPTDPLYTIDLTDPFSPTIEGRQEISGTSGLLVPINNNWLLSIGRQVEDGQEQGFKLELFDVSQATPASASSIILDHDRPLVRGGPEGSAFVDYTTTSLRKNGGDTLRLAIPAYINGATGLRKLEIIGLNGPTASLHDRGFILSDSTIQRSSNTSEDRAVLDGEALFYIYSGHVDASFWN